MRYESPQAGKQDANVVKVFPQPKTNATRLIAG